MLVKQCGGELALLLTAPYTLRMDEEKTLFCKAVNLATFTWPGETKVHFSRIKGSLLQKAQPLEFSRQVVNRRSGPVDFVFKA